MCSNTHTHTHTHISHNCDPHTITVNLMAKHNYNKHNLLSSDLLSYYSPLNTSRGSLYLINAHLAFKRIRSLSLFAPDM